MSSFPAQDACVALPNPTGQFGLEAIFPSPWTHLPNRRGNMLVTSITRMTMVMTMV